MAAPSGTQWGNIVQGSKSTRQGRIGIYVSTSSTNTQTTVSVQVWFWSMYSISDTSNSFFADWDKTYATSGGGSVSISTSVSTGSGWSTSNQVLLASYSRTHNRGTSAASYYFAARLYGIDNLGAGNNMTAYVSYTVPALASYSVSYDANGGSGAPSKQTKYYGMNLTLSKDVPTRTGYNFIGWGTKNTDTVASYSPGGTYTSNASITLYAVWQRIVCTVMYDAGTNGGKVNDAESITVPVYYGDTIGELPIAEKKNHKFIGWCSVPDGSGVFYAYDTFVYSDITVYAIFELQANCYIKDNGTYKVGMMYRKTNDVYVTGVVSVRSNGEYKESNM